MRDLNRTKQKGQKVRPNRRKGQRQKRDIGKLLRRMLRVAVALSSVSLICVGSFFAVQLLLASDLFKVKQVNVTGNERLTPRQIVVLSDIRAGMNTFSLDLALIGRQITANPWIGSVQVRRLFPDQVSIDVIERHPVAIVNLGYLYYLDDNGEVFKVLGSSDDLDYPMITGFDYDKAREHSEDYVDQFKQIVALVEELQSRQHFDLSQVSEIHKEKNGGLSLYTLTGSVRIKLGEGNYATKIDRLERIYTELKPKLKILDYIDLNVDEKVIVRIDERSQMATRS